MTRKYKDSIVAVYRYKDYIPQGSKRKLLRYFIAFDKKFTTFKHDFEEMTIYERFRYTGDAVTREGIVLTEIKYK